MLCGRDGGKRSIPVTRFKYMEPTPEPALPKTTTKKGRGLKQAHNCRRILISRKFLTLSFLSLPASHLCHQGLDWPWLIVRSIIYQQILWSVTADLIFSMVNIYIEPGVRGLTAHFLTHLFYQGHYLPCGLPNNISRGLYLPKNKVQIFWIVFCYLYFRCCYITVDFAITALQTGACTYKCIHFQTSALQNTLFTQWLYEKSGILWKLHYSILSGKNNVMLRFMEQALQIPLLCNCEIDYLSANNCDPVTSDLIFIMVNIYIEPAHFLTHLFYQGHYIPCGLTQQ